MRGRYSVVCRGKDGNVKWAERIDNLVTATGKNTLLDTMFGGATACSWYVGLISSVDYTALSVDDTMLSHPGWTEGVDYLSPYRPAASFSAASMGQKAMSAAASFDITGAMDVVGMFLCSGDVRGATDGVLYSAGVFSSGVQSLVSSDTLEVTYTAITG